MDWRLKTAQGLKVTFYDLSGGGGGGGGGGIR